MKKIIFIFSFLIPFIVIGQTISFPAKYATDGTGQPIVLYATYKTTTDSFKTALAVQKALNATQATQLIALKKSNDSLKLIVSTPNILQAYNLILNDYKNVPLADTGTINKLPFQTYNLSGDTVNFKVYANPEVYPITPANHKMEILICYPDGILMKMVTLTDDE